ncbi:MAG: hypothetical protein H6875_13545 [Hyphomicrobiaceae bacterium]|mgnify:CR=1 FL=1|nr:hypothetical protein [Hyphomicrobiaceae bacterium]
MVAERVLVFGSAKVSSLAAMRQGGCTDAGNWREKALAKVGVKPAQGPLVVQCNATGAME